MTLDIARTIADLERDEGTRRYAYDDATGKELAPGSLLIGHPTIGVGRALDLDGITPAECMTLIGNDIARYVQELSHLDWFMGLDPNRQRAIINMRHTLGLSGLLGFQRMIAGLSVQNYGAAASGVLNSRWAQSQAPARARRVAALLLTGLDGAPEPGSRGAVA